MSHDLLKYTKNWRVFGDNMRAIIFTVIFSKKYSYTYTHQL